jgi:isopenicillin-N epimerase
MQSLTRRATKSTPRRSKKGRRRRDAEGTVEASIQALYRALEFMRELGVREVRDWNHELAWEAGRWLCAHWKTELGVRESDTGTMITVPLPASCGGTREDANRLRDALLFDDGIEIQLHAWNGRLCARVSAQVYNEMADIERFGAAVLRRA